MLVSNHLYVNVSIGTHVIVNIRDHSGCPAGSISGHVVTHLQIPNTFGSSLSIKSDEDGKSYLVLGGAGITEVYIA